MDIERVKTAKLLSVLWSELPNFDLHASCILEDCTQTIHVIKRLKTHGITLYSLRIVCDSLIMSKFRYALPMWGSFLSKNMTNRINRFLRYFHSMGGLQEEITLQELANSVDNKLYISVKSNFDYVLRNIMPPIRTTCHNLRHETHDLSQVYITNLV